MWNLVGHRFPGRGRVTAISYLCFEKVMNWQLVPTVDSTTTDGLEVDRRDTLLSVTIPTQAILVRSRYARRPTIPGFICVEGSAFSRLDVTKALRLEMYITLDRNSQASAVSQFG
jgi:hypothetical protein